MFIIFNDGVSKDQPKCKRQLSSYELDTEPEFLYYVNKTRALFTYGECTYTRKKLRFL